MFITVDGFNKTGIPNTMWELVEPYSRIDSAKGVALLGVVILILSNVASNVPTGNKLIIARISLLSESAVL
jgi:Na+/H+ antiporter NhaD/arsenite permease-like protein